MAYRSHLRPRSHFKTPKDLLLAQINELQKHLDAKNAELVQLVDKESQLLEAASSRSEDEVETKNKNQEDIIQQQLSGFAMKRELLLKKIAFIEGDISRKKKEGWHSLNSYLTFYNDFFNLKIFTVFCTLIYFKQWFMN